MIACLHMHHVNNVCVNISKNLVLERWVLVTIVSLDVISHADLYVIGILKGDYAVKFKVTYKLHGRISEHVIRIYNLI